MFHVENSAIEYLDSDSEVQGLIILLSKPQGNYGGFRDLGHLRCCIINCECKKYLLV